MSPQLLAQCFLLPTSSPGMMLTVSTLPFLFSFLTLSLHPPLPLTKLPLDSAWKLSGKSAQRSLSSSFPPCWCLCLWNFFALVLLPLFVMFFYCHPLKVLFPSLQPLRMGGRGCKFPPTALPIFNSVLLKYRNNKHLYKGSNGKSLFLLSELKL